MNKIEKDLKNKQNYGKINYGDFKTEFEKEQDYPVQIRNNSQWVKDMYKDLIQNHKKNANDYNGISASKITAFEKEADEIYKLDTSKRDNPLIKGYMTGRYQIKPEEVNAVSAEKTEEKTTSIVSPRRSFVAQKMYSMLKEHGATSTLPNEPISAESVHNYAEQVSNPNEKTTVIYAYTGDVSSCEQWEVEANLKSGDWLMPEDEVVIYDKETLKPRTIKAKDLKTELKSGNYSVATDGTNIIDARTGKMISVSTSEASKLVPKDEWYAPLDRVAVYDKKTGTLSECYAYEIEEKLKEGSWALPHEKVVVYEAATGEVSECQMRELQGNLESKKWLLKDQTIKLYNPRTGQSAYYRAQDIKDNMSKYGYVTGDAVVAVYSATDGKMYNVPVTELASLKSGMTTNGKCYTAEDEVTLYDRYGRTYTVKAKDMEKVMQEKKLYSEPFVGPLTEKEIKENQKKIQADIATAFKMMGKTKYEEVTIDGETYYESLPSGMKIDGLGDSTPFVIDLMQGVSDGNLSYSEVFDIMEWVVYSGADAADYVTDKFYFIKDGDYLIVKGASSNAALTKGIRGTRYKISNLSPHTNVMKYINLKPAFKEAFFSAAGKASFATDVVFGAGFDIYGEYQNGKRGRDLAVEVVEELGTEAAMALVTTAASTAITVVTAKICAMAGTAIVPGVGTAIGLIAGIAIGGILDSVYEKYVEDDVTELVSRIFSFLGI